MFIRASDIIIDKPVQEVGSTGSPRAHLQAGKALMPAPRDGHRCASLRIQTQRPRKAGNHGMLKLIERASIAQLQMSSKNGRG